MSDISERVDDEKQSDDPFQEEIPGKEPISRYSKMHEKMRWLCNVPEDSRIHWPGTIAAMTYAGALFYGSFELFEFLYYKQPRIMGPILPAYVGACLVALVLGRQGIGKAVDGIEDRIARHRTQRYSNDS